MNALLEALKALMTTPLPVDAYPIFGATRFGALLAVSLSAGFSFYFWLQVRQFRTLWLIIVGNALASFYFAVQIYVVETVSRPPLVSSYFLHAAIALISLGSQIIAGRLTVVERMRVRAETRRAEAVRCAWRRRRG